MRILIQDGAACPSMGKGHGSPAAALLEAGRRSKPSVSQIFTEQGNGSPNAPPNARAIFPPGHQVEGQERENYDMDHEHACANSPTLASLRKMVFYSDLVGTEIVFDLISQRLQGPVSADETLGNECRSASHRHHGSGEQ